MTDETTIPATAWWHVDIDPEGLRWTLSHEARRLLGVAEGSDVPGLELVTATYHPEDGDVRGRSEAALEDEGAFSHKRRLVRPDGQVVEVMVVGQGDYTEDGRLVGVSGVFLDLEQLVGDAVAAEVTAQLNEVVEARGAIEQAKGVLMQAYGIGPDEAFTVLGWYSQRTNTRVRALAARLAEEACGRPMEPQAREAYLSARLDPRAEAVVAHVPLELWTATPAPVVVETQRVDGHVLVAVTGDVDAIRARELVPLVRDALAAVPRPSRPHVLDLSQAGYLSPAAVVGLAGVITKHLHTPAEMRVLPGWTAAALEAAGVPSSAVVR